MMLNCRKATELMSASRERPLSRWERLQLGFHNLLCRLCRQFGHDVEDLSALAHAAGETDSPPHKLSPEAKTRIATALAREPRGDEA